MIQEKIGIFIGFCVYLSIHLFYSFASLQPIAVHCYIGMYSKKYNKQCCSSFSPHPASASAIQIFRISQVQPIASQDIAIASLQVTINLFVSAQSHRDRLCIACLFITNHSCEIIMKNIPQLIDLFAPISSLQCLKTC